MQRIFKKMLFVFTFLTLCFTLSLVANAQSYSGNCGADGDNLTWTLDTETGVLQISGTGEMTDYSYSSGAPWHSYRADILEIVFSCTPENIGEYAFYHCYNVKELVIPNSVIEIGHNAFNQCRNLISVSIPNSVTFIGGQAFYYCGDLTEVNIPNSVLSIGDSAFYRCEKITYVKIPDSVTNIGNHPFYHCTSLQKIEVESGNKNYCSDENGVLYNADMTELIQYPNGNINSEYTIPDGVVKIPDFSFYSSKKLKEITIPDSVVEIGYVAFAQCSNLETINISDNVMSIGSDAFKGTAYYNNNSNWDNGVLYLGSYLLDAENISIGTYEVRSGTKLIADHAFSSKASVQNVIIPDSVIVLGAGAFYINDYIRNVTIGKGVTEIKRSTFDDCSNLKTVTFSKNVKKIGSSAFSQWTSLSEIYYSGSEDDWQKIQISSGNSRLNTVTIHYNYVPKVSLKITGREFDANIDYYTTYWDSSAYNANLANLTAALSGAVYSETDITNAYVTLGFESFNLYDYSGEFNPNSCGYAVSFKQSEYNDDTICLVTVRGSDNTSDWIGNFNITTFEKGKHTGFAYPANRIYNKIDALVQERNISGNIKYVITGHSRGAAVANLLAVKLMENGISSSNVYNYNFACPDVACLVIFPTYSNIFNLCNREDPVPFVPGDLASVFTTPGTSWGKFGQTYWFTKDTVGTNNPFDDHSIWLYLEFLDQRLNPDQWDVTFSDKVDDTLYWINGWITKILCPVDVVITDIAGNRIASVINGEVDYHNSNFGDIIIFTDGDKKIVYIKGDREFNISLIGTDNGIMTYSLEKYNLATNNVYEFKEFTNIKLYKGKKMYSPVSSAEETSTIKLFVVEELNGEDINSFEIYADGSEKEVVHIYKSVISAPTCIEYGFTTHTCLNCGDTYTDAETSALGHAMGDYVVTKQPTCTSEGVETAECERCNYIAKRSISTKSHNYEAGICTSCGNSKPDNCSHVCHKSGVIGFIWKIVRFFWKLFKMNPVCECGVAHY